jgi:hypothetical protein
MGAIAAARTGELTSSSLRRPTTTQTRSRYPPSDPPGSDEALAVGGCYDHDQPSHARPAFTQTMGRDLQPRRIPYQLAPTDGEYAREVR